MDDKSKMTLSEQIYKVLRKEIITQAVPCGKKLTLQELKDKFNVSHTPIREALTRLSEEGLLVYESNCGVTVVSYTEKDIISLFEFTAGLDAMSVLMCSGGLSAAALVAEMDELIEVTDRAYESGNMEEWEGYSEDFHSLFYKYADNRYLTVAAKKIQAQIALLSTLYQTDETAAVVQEEHHKIADHVRKNDFEGAAGLMRRHTLNDMAYALRAYRKHPAGR